MKKKHLYLLIAMLTAAAVLPIIILVCFSSANEPQRPVTIIYRNTEYAYKEFLAGCVLSCLKTLDEPPADDESEGINAVAVALDCSLRYLYSAGSLSTAVTLMLNIWMKRKAYSTSERRQAYTENTPKAPQNMPYRLTLPYREGLPFSPSAVFRRA